MSTKNQRGGIYRPRIIEAIESLNDGRRGSSRIAIQTYLANKFLGGTEGEADYRAFNRHVRAALKRGVEDGVFMQVKQSFRMLSKNELKAKVKEEKAAAGAVAKTKKKKKKAHVIEKSAAVKARGKQAKKKRSAVVKIKHTYLTEGTMFTDASLGKEISITFRGAGNQTTVSVGTLISIHDTGRIHKFSVTGTKLFHHFSAQGEWRSTTDSPL